MQDRESTDADRRSFLKATALAGAAALVPSLAEAQGAAPRAAAGKGEITVRAVEHLVGTATSYAYAVKAGPWIFLTGHEGFDFEKGMVPEVTGAAAFPAYGTPPLRREADYLVRRMATVLKGLGSDLAHSLRVDQYYTIPDAAAAYHDTRHAEFGKYIPPSTSLIMERCFSRACNTNVSMVAVDAAGGPALQPFYPEGTFVSQSSGFAPAVGYGDYVFVAGTTSSSPQGGVDPSVRGRPESRWGNDLPIRRQTEFVLRKKLEPVLKAAGSSFKQVVKAVAYIDSAENFPDFMATWSDVVGNTPCALTLVPTKAFATVAGIVEINFIALKDNAATKAEIVQAGIPEMAAYGPVVRAGDLVFASGLLPIAKDGSVAGAAQSAAFDALCHSGQAQAGQLLAYLDAICKQCGVTAKNLVRAQYFVTGMEQFPGIEAAWTGRYGKQPHPFGCIQVPGGLPAPAANVMAEFWIYAPRSA